MNITKYMQYTKIVFFTLLLASNALVGSERLMIGSSLHAPEKLGQLALGYDKDGFRILQNGQVHAVKSYHVDPVLRNISSDQLEAFLKHGYISVSQFDDEEFSLRAHVRGLGGGGATAYYAYWITKSLCYGTVVAAGTAALAATGGAAGVVLAAAATGGASAGISTAAAAVTAAGLGAEATVAVAALGATTTAFGGVAAGIEFISAGVGFIAFWLPLP